MNARMWYPSWSIGKTLNICIDDMLIKSRRAKDYVKHLDFPNSWEIQNEVTIMSI